MVDVMAEYLHIAGVWKSIIVWILWSVCMQGLGLPVPRTRRTNVNIAVLLPGTDQDLSQEPCLALDRVRPAVQIAVTHALRVHLSTVSITVDYVDTKCSDVHGVIATMNVYYNKTKSVQAFFGPCCKYLLSPIARYNALWHIPLLTPGGLSKAFLNKTQFHHLTRLTSSYDQLADFVVEIMKYHNWTHSGVIWHENVEDRTRGSSECNQVAVAIIREVRRHRDDLAEPHKDKFDQEIFDRYDWQKILYEASNKTRSKYFCFYSLIILKRQELQYKQETHV